MPHCDLRLVVFGLLCAAPAFCQSDVTPPVLTSLSLTPGIVYATSGSATLNVNFTATDDLSGVRRATAVVVSPSQRQSLNVSATFGPSANYSGSLQLSFSQYSESGTWSLYYLAIADAAGNWAYYYANDLALAGLPYSVAVVSDSDTTPPRVTALSFNPTLVDATSGPAALAISFSLTDDLSGARQASVVLLSPSKRQSQNTSISFTPSTSYTGALQLTFSSNSESGAWSVYYLAVADASGNVRYYYANDLVAAGLPATVLIASHPDTTPPRVTALSFAPASLDTTTGPATLTVNFSVTDDLSGARQATAVLLSPSRQQQINGTVAFGPANSYSGSLNITLPRFSESGTWTLYYFAAVDAAGNAGYYYANDLTSQGLPIAVTVVPSRALTTAVSPAGAGVVTSSGWYGAGAVVPVSASPNSGYQFTYFSGDLSGNSNPQTVTMDSNRVVVANFNAVAPTLSATISSRTGSAGSRQWTLRLTNTGVGPAIGAQITGLVITQTGGTACSVAPSITSPSPPPAPTTPVLVGNIAAGASADRTVTLNFAGCPATARHRVAISFSANIGGYTNSTTLNNQFY